MSAKSLPNRGFILLYRLPLKHLQYSVYVSVRGHVPFVLRRSALRTLTG